MARTRQPDRPQPTPEEREARIAQLRARRRARLRMLARRSAFTAAGLVLLLAVLAWWLLRTLGGRDFLMAQIVARLPADATLTWQRAEGPVSGPMTLHGVHFAYHGMVFDARRVRIDPDIRPLIGRLLRLDALEVEGALLELPDSEDEPFELPRWPESLPAIDVPMALQADAVVVDGFRVVRAGAGEGVIDIHRLRGGLDARAGRLHLERLAIDSDRGDFRVHGDYRPGRNYATDLTASALLPAPAGRTRPRLGLAVRGNLDDMALAVSGHAPAPLRALLTLRGADLPRWRLSACSDALDPGLLAGGEPGTPLAFDLRAEGIGGKAGVQGRVAGGDPAQGGWSAVLQPSKLRVENQVLAFEPLVVDALGGRVTARGRGDFSDPANARFKFGLDADGIRFGGDAAAGSDGAPAIEADARLGIAGTVAAWAAIGTATLRREDLTATVELDGRGSREQLRLRRLHAAMPTGTLEATGTVGWAPALRWDLDARLAGFDPGYFAPQWPGALNGALASHGSTRADGGLELEVEATDLGGQLRGRRLDGSARFAMHGAGSGKPRADYAGQARLALGGSRIEASGTVAETLDVDARFAPLQLADLLPGAAGNLRGTLSLSGARSAPDIAADLAGSGLAFGDYAAQAATIRGRLPWRGRGGALSVDARGVQAGLALDSMSVDARGAIENLRLDARARGGIGALALSGSAAKGRGGWQGTLSALRLAPARGAVWRLQDPARYAQRGGGWTLSRSCFASEAGGTLCASADWPRRGLSLSGQGLPLALVTPYLPEREDGRPWILRGEIAVDGQLRPAGDAFAGHLTVTSPQGGLRMSERARRDVVDYSGLRLRAEFDARRIRASLATAFNGDGRLDAQVATGWDAYAPLSGQIAIDTDELTWLELFSPDIVEPVGRLQGRIALSGTRAAPGLGGQASLTGFGTELPALGIALEQGDVRLDALPDGSARITGQVRSAAPEAGAQAGVLHVDGSLGWRGDGTPLELRLRGDDVLVSNTRDLRAVADPDLTVRYAAGQPLQVTGTVTVPSATIELERLDDGVSASPDVVVLDPVDPEQGPGTPLDLNLTLVMGEDVHLSGFGLDGSLGGRLRVRAVPGREMTASGELEVGGRYAAYGQELQITRGRLSWSNTPVSDPLLDIRAERRIEAQQITAGIDVTGRASSPQASVWTDPATTESEALSYLALGRSTAHLSGAESSQLNAASAALNAGGSLLAGQIGSRIGLDDAGVIESRALGGSVLGIGKQLSPRLYVGFGVSLLGTGQVLTLKYLLRKGFDIEIESSTVENRGSVNWRHEK